MELSNSENNIKWVSSDRQKALADGTFAIVMTLLVLELAVPVMHGASNVELTQALAGMWPKFLAYTLSFLVLGVFWLIHHFIFDNITYYDARLAWLNILFLLFVALVPFTTSLLGEYLLEKTPAIIYGIQLLVIFFMGFSLWTYGTSRQLSDDEIEVEYVKGGKLMGYTYFVILVAAIIIAFFLPIVSIIIYGVFVLLFILITAFGRAEYAISLRVPKNPVKE
jgi:uncharacterized membrane protein